MVRVIETPAPHITLEAVVRREVQLYAGTSDTDKLYALLDDTNKTYAVVIIPGNADDRPAWVIVMAQIIDDKVVVIEDITDQPLVEALMVNGGVPREKIILAYKGEQIPAQEL